VWSHHAVCPLQKGLWSDGCLGFQYRRVGIALAEGLYDLGGHHSAQGFHDWGSAGLVSFQLYPGICLITEEKQEKSQTGLPRSVRHYSLRRLRPLFGAASTGLLSISPPRLTAGDFREPLLGKTAFQFERRGSLHQQSKLSINPLTWSAKNGIFKSSWICPLLLHQGELAAMRRHLDWNTSSFRTWLWVADLQIGDA
jgi:hypothetical protein